MMNLFKSVGLVMVLLFITGIFLPMVISTVVLPLWMIIFTVGAIFVIWVMLIKTPVQKFYMFLKSKLDC